MADPLLDPTVIAELKRAWLESDTFSESNRHEEGGYILSNSDLSFAVERWPRGKQSRISPPALDANDCYNGRVVVATFHTHPNPPTDEAGEEWEQGPSQSDRRWHAIRKLKGFVISRFHVYEIGPDGAIAVVGRHDEVLAS